MNKDTGQILSEIVRNVTSYNPQANFSLISKAADFAFIAHSGQARYSGEPFAVHGLSTALLLSRWRLDTASVIAGIVHDSVEKGAARREDIEREFGPTVTRLVDSVTNVSALRIKGDNESLSVENLRKLIVAMSDDLRVVLIRLAERLDNMETISFIPEDSRRRRIARETLEIYAPLAGRLGMAEVRRELENLAFPIVLPEAHQKTKELSDKYLAGADRILSEMKRELASALTQEKILGFEIQGRIKSLYSIHQKLSRPGSFGQIEEIQDLIALRVILRTVEECYQVLGLIHKIWPPILSTTVSDFIASPKPNGYQSIHTKVFGPSGKTVEFQIRTFQMHDEAEYGVASHIYYSLAKSSGASDQRLEGGKVFAPTEKMKWIRQLAGWQEKITGAAEFMDYLKSDALSQRVFVFSPAGDVFDLPLGATPVDFAYAVHTGFGTRLLGAKINGRIISLDTKLQNGDVCELILAKSPKKPNAGWLDFVVTKLAKSEIKRLSDRKN